jgi:hypothetical protein
MEEKHAVKPATPFEASPDLLRTLEAELKAALRGEVRFDAGSKALYASDASRYRRSRDRARGLPSA